MRETGEAPVVLQQVSVGGAPPHAVGTYIRMVRWVVPWLRGGGVHSPWKFAHVVMSNVHTSSPSSQSASGLQQCVHISAHHH